MDNEVLKHLLEEAENILLNSKIGGEFKPAAFSVVFNVCLYRWQNQEIERQMRIQALSQGIDGHQGVKIDA
jgi:hypothetical protein